MSFYLFQDVLKIDIPMNRHEMDSFVFVLCKKKDQTTMQRKHKDFLNNMTIAGMVDLIILKAEDADGNRMFTLEDKFTLMGEPVNLIGDIAGKLFGSVASIEDQEKN